MGTVFAMLAALSLGLPIPLLAVHILFINFVMDGLIAIALGVESPEPGSMSRPPRRVSDSVLDGWSLAYVGVLGGVIAGLTVGVYQGALEDGLSQSHATTLAFTVLILSRLFNGFSCRSLTSSSFAVLFSPRHKNLPLLAGAGITIVLTAAVLFLPVLHHPFRTMALQWREILYLTGISFLVVLVAELLKLLRRRFEPAGG
jgi:Ca2+-transporting ATPase